ncbi:hypothetical protein LCGC14_2489230, partial [marine sediment metagenome]
MRHIAYQRQREEGRAQRLDALDELRSRDIQRQFQGELQRKAVLDRRDDIGSQMEVEQERKRGLDERGVPTTEEGLRRFREVEQRQQPRARPFAQQFQDPYQIPASRIPVGAPPTAEEFPQMGRGRGPGLLEMADIPRQWVKEKVIEPVVPEFEVTIPSEVTGIVAAGTPLLREAQAIGGLLGKEPPPVKITSELVEEAASWVLDPLNAVFFAGPALKGAGGAARVANQIRKSGRIPAFVRAARRLAASEAGGRRLGGEAGEAAAKGVGRQVGAEALI